MYNRIQAGATPGIAVGLGQDPALGDQHQLPGNAVAGAGDSSTSSASESSDPDADAFGYSARPFPSSSKDEDYADFLLGPEGMGQISPDAKRLRFTELVRRLNKDHLHQI